MTDDPKSRPCPQCGASLPADAPQGLCPQCLLMNGLASQASAASESSESAVNTKPTLNPSAAGSRGTYRSAYRSAGRFIAPTVEELAPLLPQMEILELLGQGGMGAVYKARQRGLDRLVAVKILPPDLGELPGFADRFTREARALAKLNHPNIVSVFDFGQTAETDDTNNTTGLYYLIMEYIDGVNLRQAMRSGALTSPDALAIVPQVCEALQFAHDEGIVHRDIKPENILLDKRGKVKIADFGLAKLVAHDPDDVTLTREGGTMGTPHYMAPEQVQGAHGVDHRADIYSLGVVFYEMLTGELPLGRFAVPSKKVKIDVRLDEVVLRSLEREPELRYQQASEMKTQVDHVRGLTPAMVDSDPHRDPDSVQAAPKVFVIMAVVTLVSAVFTFLLLAGAIIRPYSFDAFFRRDEVRFTLMTMQCLAVPAGIVMLLGGLNNGASRAGRRRAAAVMGMLPLTPAWLITLPLALWTLGITGSDRDEGKARTSSLQNDPAEQVHAPATWLAGVAVLNWLIITMLIILMAMFGPPHLLPGHLPVENVDSDRSAGDIETPAGEIETPHSNLSGPQTRAIGRKPVPTGPLVSIIILSALASGIMYIGAMRMRRLEGRGLAKLGAVCAMIVTPGNILGLPVGIWVLEVLSRRKVRDAFAESASASHDPRNSQTSARPHTLLPALAVCLGTLPYLYATVLSVANGFDISDGNDSTPAYIGYLMMLLGVVLLMMVALILRGAWHLLSLSRRGPAVLGSLLAFPLGLWALVVLSRPAVRDAFEEQHQAATPALARPRSVPVLAIVNILFGVVTLFMVVLAALPADGSDELNALWDQATPALTTVRTLEMVLLPVQYVAAGLMLASGIGLLMWKPWGRKLAVGVCIYMLIDFFVQVPILVMSGLLPMWKLVRDPRYANAMQITDMDELLTFTIILTCIGLGLALMILTYLIAQLVLLTSPRIVAAMAQNPDASAPVGAGAVEA